MNNPENRLESLEIEVNNIRENQNNEESILEITDDESIIEFTDEESIVDNQDIDDDNQDVEDNSSDLTCLICMEETIDHNSILVSSESCGCNKYYHIRCFLTWYNQEKKCLICHKPLSESDINIYIFSINENLWEQISLSSLKRLINCQEFDIEANRNNNNRSRNRNINRLDTSHRRMQARITRLQNERDELRIENNLTVIRYQDLIQDLVNDGIYSFILKFILCLLIILIGLFLFYWFVGF